MSFNAYSNYIRTLKIMADQCRGMLSEYAPWYPSKQPYCNPYPIVTSVESR